MPVNEELLRVLEAREERWNRRLALSRGTGRTLVTATLCLPVAYRTAPEFKVLLRRLCSLLREQLAREGLDLREEEPLDGADGPALFFTVSAPAATVKERCVEAEDRLPGGRMLDIDVMDCQGEPVGRAALGLPPRRCFVCGEAAALCVSRKVHPKAEIDARVEQLRRDCLAGLEATEP